MATHGGRSEGVDLIVVDRLTVFAFRAAWAALPRTPEVLATFIFNLLSDLAWLHNGSDVQRLQTNLARVTGRDPASDEVRQLTRRALRSYGRYWREMFSLSAWSQADIEQRLRVIGKEHLDAAVASGRGAVLAGTHSGNWDLPGLWAGREYGRVTTVAERLKPEELFDAFVEKRSAHGLEIVPHRGGARSPFAILLERVRAGGIVALVSDRDLSERGVEVQFFGATARMAAGPAALARGTGAALMPVAVWNDGPTVVLHIHAPLQVTPDDTVEDVCQRIADVFASDIAAHAEDWHMMQRVWIGVP